VIADHRASAANQHSNSTQDSGAAPLTLKRVVADMQLLLAVRRHARTQESARARN
jgi:hypothetical protein